MNVITTTKKIIKVLSLITVAILVVIVAMLLINHKTSAPNKLTTSDKILCSDERNLCFTYPSSWKKSTISHGSNFYGETSLAGVELNPPSGTILTFSKSDVNSNTKCKRDDTCEIAVNDLVSLNNGLYVLKGTFIIKSSSNNSKNFVADTHDPFITLLSSNTVNGKQLISGKTIKVADFNPGASFNSSTKSLLLVVPEKMFSQADASKWLGSGEANSAVKILSSASKQ